MLFFQLTPEQQLVLCYWYAYRKMLRWALVRRAVIESGGRLDDPWPYGGPSVGIFQVHNTTWQLPEEKS